MAVYMVQVRYTGGGSFYCMVDNAARWNLLRRCKQVRIQLDTPGCCVAAHTVRCCTACCSLYVLIPRPLFGRAIYNYWNILDLASRLDWWTGTKIIQMWSNETPLVRSCVETPQSSFCMVLKQITPTEGFVVLTTEQLATLVAGDNGYEKLVLATWAQITSYNWQPS